MLKEVTSTLNDRIKIKNIEQVGESNKKEFHKKYKVLSVKPGHQMHKYKMGTNCQGSSAAEKHMELQEIGTQV